jgi:hypothetical protein
MRRYSDDDKNPSTWDWRETLGARSVLAVICLAVVLLAWALGIVRL